MYYQQTKKALKNTISNFTLCVRKLNILTKPDF